MDKKVVTLRLKASTKSSSTQRTAGAHAVNTSSYRSGGTTLSSATKTNSESAANVTARGRDRLAQTRASLRSFSLKKCYTSTSTLVSMYGKGLSRSLQALLVLFFVSMFVAAARRVLARRRKRVLVETVEKPRAAFKIQTAWRAYRQRCRIHYGSAVRLLVLFLRRKLRRIRAMKEKAALLLQRVFRSQRERHFVHWLYCQMRYNRALHLIRQRLRMRVAKRHVEFLTLQRDELLVCERRCVIATLSLLRQERSELLQIVHSMNQETKLFLKPFVTKPVLAEETVCGTGAGSSSLLHSSLPAMETSADPTPFLTTQETTSEVTLSDFSVSGSGNIVLAKGGGSNTGAGTLCVVDNTGPHCWTSALHDEEHARQFVERLFERKLPSYALLRKDSKRLSSKTEVAKKAHNTPNFAMCDFKPGEAQNLCLASPLSHRGNSLRRRNVDVGSKEASLQGEVILNASKASSKRLMEAFIELLVRTEATERKVLMLDLQNRHRELMQLVDWFYATIRATYALPPLYVSILPSMGEAWAVRRMEQLLRQEHKERLKIVADYVATPLQFLDRPLFNSAAEERRKRLQKRLQTIKNMCNAEQKRAVIPDPSSMPEEGQWDISQLTALASLAQETCVSNAESLTSKSLNQRPPSPPPRRAHGLLLSPRAPVGSNERRFQRHHYGQGSFRGATFHGESSLFLRVFSPDSVSEAGEGNVAVSVYDPSVSRSGPGQDSMLPKPAGFSQDSDVNLPGFLPFVHSIENDKNNITPGSVSGAVPATPFSLSLGVRSPRHLTDSSSLKLPFMKRVVFGGRDGNNVSGEAAEGSVGLSRTSRVPVHLVVPPARCCRHGAWDPAALQKGLLRKNQKRQGGVARRGLPAPRLRTASTDRGTMSAPLRSRRIVKQEMMTRKETGADYVHCRVP